MYDFKNKNAIISGAGKGIGRAIACKLASDGCNLLLLDINKETLDETKQLLSKYNIDVETQILDISNEEEVNKIINDYINSHKHVDILINNASIYHNHCNFRNSTSKEWINKINVNILGTVYLCKAVVENMVSNKYGRIINLASVAGVYGDGGMVDYATTKGAIISFTKSLAKEISGFGITVNAVSPGTIDVGSGNLPEHSFIGRSGTPEECANLVVFLASDEASYISGQNYLVDGCRRRM